MKLPRVNHTYSPMIERERNRTLELEDGKNRKSHTDVEIGEERLILTSPDGTRFSIVVSNAGAITASSL